MAQYTDEQLRAIRHSGGHSITHAVAGSGKTHMMVGRVQFLLEQGVPAHQIRVLAFNVAAVAEFRARLAACLPAGMTPPEVKTFNAIGAQLLKRFEAQGWAPRLRLETGAGTELRLARQAASAALRERNIHTSVAPDEIEALCQFIGLVKSEIGTPEEAFERFNQPAHLEYFVRAFALFEAERLKAGVRFFADQIAEPVALMRAHAEALAMVTNRIDTLLIDEWQDVNRVQVELVKQILGTRGELCCVGDVDQTIYAWRGSRPEYMLAGFTEHFGEASRYQLTRTFRFGHKVSLAAAQLIARNRARADTLCVSATTTPETRIHLVRESAPGEPTQVLAAIEAWRAAGRPLGQCAVLGRLWAHLMGVELGLLARDIPYAKPGRSVFEMPAVCGLLGYLRLAAGTLFTQPDAGEIVRNMLSTPTLWLSATALRETVNAILANPGAGARILGDAAAHLVQDWRAERVRARARVWAQAEQWGELPAEHALREYAAGTDLLKQLTQSSTTQDASEKALAYETLVEWASHTKDTVAEFIARMERMRTSAERYKGGADNAVLLTSIHAVKGCEFPMVVVMGLEEGAFPSPRADSEEERRLCYVAITRAQEALYLVAPPDARLDAELLGGPGPGAGRARARASPFVLDMQLGTSIRMGEHIRAALQDPGRQAPLPSVNGEAAHMVNRYLEEVGLEARIAAAPALNAHNDNRPWRIADRVRHKVFGDGVVVGFIDKEIIEVQFGAQRRSLKIGVAPMQRVALAP